jgi:hypothetical protein
MLKGAMPMLRMRVKRGWGVIGVQGREHQVTGLRSLDGNVGRLQVTDFTHHDDVGILALRNDLSATLKR